MQKLSEATGAVIFDEYGPCNLKDIQFQHLGRARRVEMDEFETTVFGKADQEVTNAVIYAGGSTE